MNRIEKLLGFLSDSPDDSFLQHALALEYVKAGDDGKAISLFQQILDREPGYIGSYYHLGKALERTGKFEEAVRVYESGMDRSRDAKDQHAYNELQSAHEDCLDI